MTAIASPTSESAGFNETTPDEQLTALLEAVGLVPLNETGWLRVTGEDRVRWLNGMTTNSIQELAPGQGNYNFFLSAQGRIQGDAFAFAAPDSILLETDRARLPALITLLDRFIIMDDVELTPAYEDEAGLMLIGPEAQGVLGKLGLPAVDPLRLVQADTEHGPVLLFTPPLGPFQRYELRGDTATIDGLRKAVAIPEVSAETLESLRLVEARPLFGADIRERDLPQETGQDQALHFSKGCYLGQEIVERIHSRGQVHRQFTAFRLTGDLPETLPAPLEAGGKPAGELTSAAVVSLPEGPALVALGYARREALETRQPLTYTGGIAHPHPTK